MKTRRIISTLPGAVIAVIVIVILGFLVRGSRAAGDPAGTGVFSSNGDVGKVLKPGSVKFDSGKGTYLVAGSGENMWATADAFHFVWKKVSGDVALAANITWIGTSEKAHRKAALIIRQSLDPDSPYADAVLHGDGLTSLQYRETRGGPTRYTGASVRLTR